jgi:acetyl-CoA C-acetyltransferase
VPVPVRVEREQTLFDTDEHPRASSVATLAAMKPAFKDGAW